MTWQPLATIELTTNWLLTEPVTGSLFRIKQFSQSLSLNDLRAIVAQAFDQDTTTTYFDVRRIAYKSEIEGYLFIQPKGLLNRKLAVKRLDTLEDSWTITIEVLDGMPESISLPIALNEVEGLEAALNDKARVESLNIHVADTDNPHSVTAAQIGAELTGASAAAASAVAAHKSEEDPHSQYATDASLALVQSTVTNKEAAGTAAAAITAHEAITNHPLVSGDPEAPGDGFMWQSDKLKLDTIAIGATANATNTQLCDRLTHTGTQPVSSIEGLGNAATRNIGTTAGTVAAGDDSRLINARTPIGTAGGVLSGNYPNPSFAAGVFARSLGNPGWEKLQSGKVQEWGSTVLTLNVNGDGSLVLPLALSTAVYSFSVVNGDANVHPDRIFSCNTTSLTNINFSIRPNPGAVIVRVNWHVIGA